MSGNPIVYIYATGSLSGHSSVQQKIVNQISVARKLGVDMEGWFFTVDQGELPEADGYRWFRVPCVNSGYFRSVRQLALTYNEVYKTLKRQLISNARVYMRYGTPGISMLRIALFLRGRFVLNHVSKESRELALYNSQSKSKFSRILGNIEFKWWPLIADYTWGILLRKIVGRCIVNSDDIAKHQCKMTFGKYHCAIIPDGVITDEYPIVNVVPPANEIRLIFLKGATTDAMFNGLDRLLEGICQYRGKRKFHLTLIGSNLEHEKKLFETYNTQYFVTFKDQMNHKELNEEFNKHHLGVGALAFHRKGLHSNSTLKSREYFARGIPFFQSHFDPDISRNNELSKYCLHIPATESPVDLSTIEDFVDNIYETPNFSQTMHSLARKHLDYRLKVGKIASFIQAN